MATSNFEMQDNFPLFASSAFDAYEYKDEETGETLINEEGDWLLLCKCENKITEFNKTLDYYELSIESGYYSGVQAHLNVQKRWGCEIPLTEEYTAKEWHNERMNDDSFYDLPYSLRKRAELRELKRIIAFCRTALKAEYHFYEYGISARFSNGETLYSRVA